MLKFVFSTMNAGKTTRLLQTLHSIKNTKFPQGEHTAIVLGYAENTRDKGIESRTGLSTDDYHTYNKDTNIRTFLERHLFEAPGKVIAVLIDEAQFLTPTQVEELREVSIERNILVECYGLKTTFTTHLFPGSKRLLELADVIEELALPFCECGGTHASVNVRLNDEGRLIVDGPEIMIEGSQSSVHYNSVCHDCFYMRYGGNYNND
jgi:thymidine kinase